MENKKQNFDTNIIVPTLERLENDPSVIGVMVVGNDGYPIRSSLDGATTINYLENFGSLIELARYTVRNLDPTDELNFLRMRTSDYEVMIAPEKENNTDHFMKSFNIGAIDATKGPGPRYKTM